MATAAQPDPPAFLPRAATLAALLTIPFGIQEASAHPADAGWILAARGFTAAAFLATGVALRRIPSGARRRTLARTVMVVTVLLSMPTIAALGGLDAPAIWLLAASPLFVSLMLPDMRSIAAVAVASSASALTAIHLTGGGPLDAFAWLAYFGVSTAGGSWAALAWQRLCAARTVDAEARLAAARKMAELERERAQEERFATVGRMVAGLAHEINNPLAVIRANVEFLEDELRAQGAPMPPSEKAELLGDVRDSALRIQRLVADMREFTRKSDPTIRTPVAEAAEACVRLARIGAAASTTITFETDGSAPVAMTSRTRLEQVFMSVLLNALDALEPARSARPDLEPRVEVSLHSTSREARVRIADNGPGIPDSVLPHVFEPFFTTKEPGKGTGLGLAIARELVAQAGGRITAANRESGGAVIEISLPVPPEVVPDARTADSPAA